MRGPKKNHVSKRLAKAWDAIGQGAPELMEHADFAYARAVRPPRQKAPRKREAPRQRAIVNGLRKRLPAGSIVWATTNHSRSRNQTFFLMSQGMVPGFPDLCVLTPTRYESPVVPGYKLHCIEVKDEGQRARPNQLEVHAQLRALGVPVLSECCELERAIEFLREHGVELA